MNKAFLTGALIAAVSFTAGALTTLNNVHAQASAPTVELVHIDERGDAFILDTFTGPGAWSDCMAGMYAGGKPVRSVGCEIKGGGA